MYQVLYFLGSISCGSKILVLLYLDITFMLCTFSFLFLFFNFFFCFGLFTFCFLLFTT